MNLIQLVNWKIKASEAWFYIRIVKIHWTVKVSSLIFLKRIFGTHDSCKYLWKEKQNKTVRDYSWVFYHSTEMCWYMVETTCVYAWLPTPVGLALADGGNVWGECILYQHILWVGASVFIPISQVVLTVNSLVCLDCTLHISGVFIFCLCVIEYWLPYIASKCCYMLCSDCKLAHNFMDSLYSNWIAIY